MHAVATKEKAAITVNSIRNTRAVQPKREVNQPNDPDSYREEREADAVADKVMRMSVRGTMQRNCAHCKEEEKNVQRKAVSQQMHDIAGSSEQYSSNITGGEPMHMADQRFFGSALNYDFSKVRIHKDPVANNSARSINARAYTKGTDIVFGSNEYQPQTAVGKRLLAHELAHVIQQEGIKENGLIQRDAATDGKQAELNFKNDWQNNFSYYDQFITIVSRVFDKAFKGSIRATKKDKDVSVILGEKFAKESDEPTRWGYIKTEIIDKFVTVDRFEDVAYDPTRSKINEINPPYAAGQYCALNCPATAAALSDYLKTGKVNKAICNPRQEGTPGYGFVVEKNTFSKAVNWKNAEKQIRAQLKKHGNYVVVEAKRSQKQMDDNHLAEYHYFTVVNVKGKLFVIDAFGGGIVTEYIQNYIDQNIIATTYRLVKGDFKVEEYIPKN
ncbi:eCIS core domain-containing protein [Niabella ginsenosidivorans]|nr:DUF4157 domain-containing protein [Niabella ginsenosidivorans]